MSRDTVTMAKYVVMFLCCVVITAWVFSTAVVIHDIVTIIFPSDFSFSDKVLLLYIVYTSPLLYLSVAKLVALSIIALLLSLYATLQAYLFRKRQMILSGAGMSSTGLFSMMFAIVGIGCAACGSVLIWVVISLLGTGLGIFVGSWLASVCIGISMVILLYANYRVIKKLQHPMVCSL